MGHATIGRENRDAARLRVVGSIRVSTEEQSREGVSLDAQRARLASYCELYDLDLIEVVADEGISAKTLQRPGLIRALGMLDRGEAGGLVVVKLDRLTRSLRDWDHLITRYFNDRRGIRLMSVNEQIDTRTANGRMMLNMLVLIAQWEREVIGERTSDALQHKIRIGTRCGTLRYGFDVDPGGPRGKKGSPVGLVPNQAEQAAIVAMRGLRDSGLSSRAIAARLDEEGVPTKTGAGPWCHQAVDRILKRA